MLGGRRGRVVRGKGVGVGRCWIRGRGRLVGKGRRRGGMGNRGWGSDGGEGMVVVTEYGYYALCRICRVIPTQYVLYFIRKILVSI